MKKKNIYKKQKIQYSSLAVVVVVGFNSEIYFEFASRKNYIDYQVARILELKINCT